MMLPEKNVLVVGLGKSGQAAIELLLRKGAHPLAFDSKRADELGAVSDWLREKQIPAYCGEDFLYPQEIPIDLLVVSPGISMQLPVIAMAQEKNIPIWSELELAYQVKPAGVNLLGITGTNGKTTTTHLVADILERAGYPVCMGGNVGTPLSALAEEFEQGYWVVEISSFQLEAVHDFHAEGAAILNITPDHLDRHITMENYISCKKRIYNHQIEQDFTLLNADDPVLKPLTSAPDGRVFFFSLTQRLTDGIWVEDEKIVFKLGGSQKTVCLVSELKLRGKHNLENVLCAVGMAALIGVSIEVMAASLRAFAGVRHRIEEAAYLNGVLYVNDSKGTNQVSTIKALEAFAEPIVLIAGGYDKGTDFDELPFWVKKKVKHLILMGATQHKIAAAMIETGYPQENILLVASLAEAVQRAQIIAVSGDVVLLSPACASWDSFKSYEERGDVFCQLVKKISQ